jgi:putative tolA protein
MELKEVYAALEAAENGAAMVEAIKSELAGVRKEAADARIGRNKAEEALTALKTEHEALAEKHKELETQLGAARQEGAGAQTEMQKLQGQIADLAKKYEVAEAARKTAEEKRVQADIMAQTVDALTKANAVDPQEFAKLIAPSIKVAEDGTYGYTKADGSQGSIADSAAEWLSDKAWAVKDVQRRGSGDGRSGDNGAGGTVAEQFATALGG